MNVGGIVLCGGRSSRMGRAKAWLPFGDEPLLARVVRVLCGAVDPVVVVAAPGQDVPPLPANVAIVRDDIEGKGPLAGLAAGLAALDGRADAVYLSACDAPFLSVEFVRRVVGLLEEPNPPTPFPRREGGAGTGRAGCAGRPDATVPPTAGTAGPTGGAGEIPRAVGEASDSPFPPREGGGGVRFFAAAVPLIDNRLHPLAAAYRQSILPEVRRRLDANELRATALFDAIPTRTIAVHELPDLAALRNINTPDDYAAALRDLAAPRSYNSPSSE